MPQLDRYLVSAEILWFLMVFIVLYSFSYFFLFLVFNGSRLRQAVLCNAWYNYELLQVERVCLFFSEKGQSGLVQYQLNTIELDKVVEFILFKFLPCFDSYTFKE